MATPAAAAPSALYYGSASAKANPAKSKWIEGFDIPRATELVAALGTSVQLPRNAEVYGEDESADYVYVVLSGVVRVCKLLGDGRRQIDTFCLAGDAFGWEIGPRYRYSAEVVSECRLARVKRSILMARASDDAELAQALWSMSIAELQRAQEHLLLLGRKTAQERVATFLLDLAPRTRGADNEVQLPMSRQDIADFLGLTIETVSRTLTSLEEATHISLPSSRRILLRDRAALERLDV